MTQEHVNLVMNDAELVGVQPAKNAFLVILLSLSLIMVIHAQVFVEME